MLLVNCIIYYIVALCIIFFCCNWYC